MIVDERDQVAELAVGSARIPLKGRAGMEFECSPHSLRRASLSLHNV